MNRFIVFVISVLLISVSSVVFAQTKPVVGAKTSSIVSQPAGKNSAVHTLSERMRADMMQINKDQKSGKLSKAQAKSLQDQVKAIHKQEVQYLKTNGNRQLTPAQVTSLNQSLDAIQSSI